MEEKAKVYFTDLHTTHDNNLLKKLEKLVTAAGMDKIDFKGKYVAIKIHFGEPGNLAYLRPNYAKVIVDMVKRLGGKPFLTDCNTLYIGRRSNAIDHLEAAYENGYNPFTVGCPIIIADGLKGTDEAVIPIDGEYISNAKIGHALADADIIISLSHFKGHEATGFGGTFKNIGMGGGSRAGKNDMHSCSQPLVQGGKCIGCGACTRACAHDAIRVYDHKASIDYDKCMGCGRCVGACPQGATCEPSEDANDILNCKMAEYTYAIIKDKPNFHISLMMDISPLCDCYGDNDLPILPDIGMAASFDPVALDKACADLCNTQPVMPGSCLDVKPHNHHDHFTDLHPDTNWRSTLEHAEKLKLGTMNYELIRQ